MHVNMREMFSGLNMFRKKMLRDKKVDALAASLPQHLSTLVEEVVCQNEDRNAVSWKKECVKGECQDCGMHKLEPYLQEFLGDNAKDFPKVRFEKFVTVTREDKRPGKEGKKFSHGEGHP
jgi:hypothetical protein